MSKEKEEKCRKEKCRMQLTLKIKCRKGVGECVGVGVGECVGVGVGVGEGEGGWMG